MSNRKVRWFVGGILGLTIVAAMAAGTSELRADAKRNELDRLLDLGWKAKPDNTREVDGYYEELFASSSRDPQVTYAYALVKIKLRKYSEAADLIDEVLDQQPKNLIAWRAKLWLATILKNYSEALVVAQKYVDAFPAPPAGDAGEGIEAKPDASKTGKSSAKGATAKAGKSKVGATKGLALDAALVADPALEHATFLGRIFGYMEGPQADAVPKATHATARKKIVERLTDDRRKAFEDGAKELVDEFLELSEAKEVGREQAKEQAEQDKEERLKTIDAQRERDKQRSSELTSTKDRIRADYESQVRDLQKQDEPLARQFAQLDSQGTFARNEQARLLLEARRFSDLANREKDGNARSRWLRDSIRYENQANLYTNQIANIDRQAANIAAQRADLQRKLALVQANLGRQLTTAEKELADVQKRIRKGDAEEGRLRRSTGGPAENSQSLARAAVAAALSTYEPFPLDEERNRLTSK